MHSYATEISPPVDSNCDVSLPFLTLKPYILSYIHPK
jgi:hypothetical protein